MSNLTIPSSARDESRPTSIRFTRTILAIGELAFEKLQAAHVTIIGLGAVGGFAAEGLARSGIGHLTLIDIDTIQRTNINRQIVALESTLDRPKVDVAAERLRDINPDIDVKPVQRFFNSDTADELLTPRPDFVIDAIDAVGPKVNLIEYCVMHEIPIVSSMGAALKTRIDNVRITDISRSEVCSLAKKVRKGLHKRGIRSGVTVVFSSEKSPAILDPEDVDNPEILSGTHAGRPRRILGSLCPITAVFGMFAAHHVLMQIGGPPEPPPRERIVSSVVPDVAESEHAAAQEE